MLCHDLWPLADLEAPRVDPGRREWDRPSWTSRGARDRAVSSPRIVAAADNERGVPAAHRAIQLGGQRRRSSSTPTPRCAHSYLEIRNVGGSPKWRKTP